MKKYFLLFAVGVSILTGCSNDDEVMNDTLSEGADIGVRSALDKVFTVEKVAHNLFVGAENANIMCTDLDGNFYYITGNWESNEQEIKKYDSETKEIISLVKLQVERYNKIHAIAVDSQKNLYYVTNDKLFKVSIVDGSITDLTSRIEFPVGGRNITLCGLCSADNGNVFLSSYCSTSVSYPGYTQEVMVQQMFKITLQGKVVEITSFEEGELPFYLKGTDLSKSKGSYLYATCTYDSYSYLKINTINGNIERLIPARPVQAISATHSQDNPYALRGHDIVRLRPAQNSDLLIGTIPSYIRDEEGNLVAMTQPKMFCMNADATIFYIVTYDNYSARSCYKLTLE